MPSLTLRFTKVSATHHRFEYVREDGSGESVELESKSFLFHDFIHLALESEAGFTRSFFGSLARGGKYDALAPEGMGGTLRDERAVTERLVGGLTGVVRDAATPAEFLSAMRNAFDAYHEPIPEWLTQDLVVRTKERFRKIWGEWKSLPFGETLELRFEA
ncbi:MAG TPA: hypothetical protein VD967_02795 [Candidatus Paceibacterota bacterium]|nr:hypothetical protein [Candidatus Paceibacterota bacterium]